MKAGNLDRYFAQVLAGVERSVPSIISFNNKVTLSYGAGPLSYPATPFAFALGQ